MQGGLCGRFANRGCHSSATTYRARIGTLDDVVNLRASTPDGLEPILNFAMQVEVAGCAEFDGPFDLVLEESGGQCCLSACSPSCSLGNN